MIKGNAGALAKLYRKRIDKLKRAYRNGLKKAAAMVDAEQVKNLRGSNSDDPGSYPVPNRSGDLMRGHFFSVESDSLAFVGNTSGHALAIHNGLESSEKHGPREFLDDAAAMVDFAGVMGGEVREAVFAL